MNVRRTWGVRRTLSLDFVSNLLPSQRDGQENLALILRSRITEI